MNDSGQYMVQVGGDFDQNTYIIQDANGLPVQYEGGTIIQGDLSDGNNLLNDNRWIQQSGGRGGKILNSQNYLNGDLVSVNGTGLNLNTRYTPSSIVLNSSNAGTQFDQDNMRLATAVTGAGGRGRPRGRKPSRGNFPVVPIDMVRQLGIEQQVILQPTVPVAMKNKTTMCKPLLMSKKTQCNENDISGMHHTGSEATTIKYIYTPVFIPVPVPVYIPVPTFVKIKSQLKDEENPIAIEVVEEAVEEPIQEVYQADTSLLQTENIYIEDTKVIESINFPNQPEEALTIVSTETEHISNNNTIVPEKEPETKKRPSTDEEVSIAKIRKVDTIEKKEADSCKLKYCYGINAWRHWSKNVDLLKLSVTDINIQLEDFVQKIRKPTNEVYVPDSIFYLCLGIQLFLYEQNYDLNLFIDPRMKSFQVELNKILATFKPKLSDQQVLVCRIEEEHLWESQQFGLFSPGVLVFSVCYLLTRQLKLKTAIEHSQLSLSQLEVTESQVIYHPRDDEESTVICDRGDGNRCFYTILSAYVDKCNETKAQMEAVIDTDPLYMVPVEREDKGGLDSGLWYEAAPMALEDLEIMLNRIRIVKEVQESLLSLII